MKLEMREREIEFIAETDHERQALARLHAVSTIGVKLGKSRDPSWPPDPKQTNIILEFPDSTDWGT
jgi:4'-phosphopantetheinyl transferase EntD